MEIRITGSDKLPVRLALASASHVRITQQTAAFDHMMKLARAYREQYPDASPGDIKDVQMARRLFRAVSIDPTRRRPASEALLQRAFKRKPLPHVNTAVDVGNWCALDFLLPTCVYDYDKIRGSIQIRQGETDESYLALNNREIQVKGKYVLADSLGPFGSPITDSQRTCVRPLTRTLLFGIWAPDDLDETILSEKLECFAHRIQDSCGGDIADSRIFSTSFV